MMHRSGWIHRFGLIFVVTVVLTSLAGQARAQDDRPPIDLNVRDAELSQVLQSLASQAKVNIIISPKVKGTVTCRVQQMDPLELLQFICRTNGLVLEDHGNILLVMQETPPGNRTRFEVIPLQNAKAADVEKMINQLKMDKRAKVTHDERTNRLIVIYEE